MADKHDRNARFPADMPEADALEQARPVGDDEEEALPPRIEVDQPEADALDQARSVDLDDEQPA